MAGDPNSGQTPGVTHASSRLARWADRLAAAVAVLAVLTGALFTVAYARGSSANFSDNWVGYLGAGALFIGMVVSLVAFVLAITAKNKHEKWAWQWLPLLAFPVLLAFIVLGDIFWSQ